MLLSRTDDDDDYIYSWERIDESRKFERQARNTDFPSNWTVVPFFLVYFLTSILPICLCIIGWVAITVGRFFKGLWGGISNGYQRGIEDGNVAWGCITDPDEVTK